MEDQLYEHLVVVDEYMSATGKLQFNVESNCNKISFLPDQTPTQSVTCKLNDVIELIPGDGAFSFDGYKNTVIRARFRLTFSGASSKVIVIREYFRPISKAEYSKVTGN